MTYGAYGPGDDRGTLRKPAVVPNPTIADSSLSFPPRRVLDAEEVGLRVDELRRSWSVTMDERARTRAIMNWGADGIRELLGREADPNQVPVPNLMASGLTRMAQRIGTVPNLIVPPPYGSDTDTERDYAQLRTDYLRSSDDWNRLDMQLPQQARWTVGYGFSAWVLSERTHPLTGYPYVAITTPDSYDCYPGPWGMDQQPRELVISRRIDVRQLQSRYPDIPIPTGDINAIGLSSQAIDLATPIGGRWEGSHPKQVVVTFYYDESGCYVFYPFTRQVINYSPNPLRSGPPFVIFKRFAFDQLMGQYTYMVGLLATLARLNMLAAIFMQDAVFTETNIYGDPPTSGPYQKGREKVNVLSPGSRVEKPANNMPYQTFEQINRVERQLRIVSGYPVTDDGEPDVSFLTGQGLRELRSSVSMELREYQTSLGRAVQDLDGKRLEWENIRWPSLRKPFPTEPDIPATTKLIPSTHINGRYRTQRSFGVLSGWDEAERIITGLQLVGADVLDIGTLRENITGILDPGQVEARVNQDRAERVIFEGLLAMAQAQDPRAMLSLVQIMNHPAETNNILAKFFTPDEPQMSAEEEQFAQPPMPGMPGGAMPEGAPPDAQTVLSRLMLGGEVAGGAQTVAPV